MAESNIDPGGGGGSDKPQDQSPRDEEPRSDQVTAGRAPAAKHFDKSLYGLLRLPCETSLVLPNGHALYSLPVVCTGERG